MTVSDAASTSAWDENEEWCLQTMNSVFYECTIPPSDACCAEYGRFNGQGCHCVDAVRAAGGADLQLATLLSRRDMCATPLVLQDDPQCFMPPVLVSASGGGDTPPVPAPLPTPPPAAEPPQPATAPQAALLPGRWTRQSARERARAAAPYVGVVAVVAAATAVATRVMARRVQKMLRLGQAEGSLLHDERLLKPLVTG